LNSSAALLTAYSMNAQVLALVGQIPDRDIGRKLGHLHEINDQAGILARLVDHRALVPDAARRRAWWRRPSARWRRDGPARPRSNARSMCGASRATARRSRRDGGSAGDRRGRAARRR
jgi:hypothetical protein